MSCVQCNENFKNKTETIDHMDSVHKLDVKCTFCKYTTFHKGHLESHLIKKHSDDGEFEYLICSICQEFRCRTNSEMEKHCRHKHFYCNRCTIQFIHKSDIADHLEAVHNCKNLKVCTFFEISFNTCNEVF